MSDPAPHRGTMAMPWFEAATYLEVRSAMADASKLPTVYGDWLISAEQVEGELKRVGFEIRRVAIDGGDFLDWCRGEGLAPDGSARSAYAKAKGGA